jgi:hypothetical protein
MHWTDGIPENMEYSKRVTIRMSQSRYCEVAKKNSAQLLQKLDQISYRKRNLEMVKKREKEYREIRAQPKTCECGLTVSTGYYERHLKRNIHTKNMQEKIQDNVLCNQNQ